MTIESAGYARQTPRRLPTYGRYVHAKPRQRFAPPLIRRFAPPSPRFAAIRCTHLFLEFFDELRFAAGADSGADDGFERGRCGAIWGWGIWGRAARKKGALCHASLVARPGSCV